MDTSDTSFFFHRFFVKTGRGLLHNIWMLPLMLLGAAPVLAASLLLAPYPPPGGITATNDAGNPAMAGGKTWTLSTFNFGAFTKLYYTIGDYNPNFSPAGPSLDMDGVPATLAYDAVSSDLVNGKVVWLGATNMTYDPGTGFFTTVPVSTRFTLTVTDLVGTPLALTDASTITGMPISVGGAYDVAGDYKANWLFEAQAPDTGLFEPALDMFNRMTTDPLTQLNSSVGGGFYYTLPIPTVSVGVNATALIPNDIMSVTVTTTEGTTPTVADIYIALQLPNGTLLVMQPDLSFGTNITPVISNWTVTPVSNVPIFNYTFTGAEPAGTYTWFGLLTTPGTLTPIGAMNVVPITFAPAPLP